jgi:hypothetical protein
MDGRKSRELRLKSVGLGADEGPVGTIGRAVGSRPHGRAAAREFARALLVATVVLHAGNVPAGDPADVSDLAYTRAAAAPVVTFTEIPAELEDADPGPTMTIYGDGRATVHYPRYMVRRGDYEIRLSPAELDALVASLVRKGLADFDREAVLARKQAASASRAALSAVTGAPALSAVADASTTVIELHLERSRPAGARAPLTDVVQRISWQGIAWDARQYPDIVPLQDLAAARQELRAVMDRVDVAAAR